MPGFTSGYIYGDPAPHHLGYSVNMLPPQNGLHVQADVGGMPFAFKKRIERIDWRKIASIDVDRVARDLDFGTLQENIMNLTFCNIESEVDVTTMDPNFTKLFKIAQLTIEYLLHSQDYLTSAMACHEEKLQKSFDQSEDLQKQLAVRKQELVDVKRECHKRKKLLVAQQQILQAGPDTYNKCPFCQKAFLSQSFLQSHIVRRHGEYSSAYGLQPATVSAASMSPTGSGNEILEKELREIKERLHATETQLHSERESLKHLLIEKESTKEIIHEKESSRIDLEHWKEDQIHQQKEELESVRHMFMKELKEMNEKYQMSEQALFELQHKYGRKSNLGQLQDDNDDGKNDFLSSQKEEINQLKEQLKDQINLVESSVRTRFDDQDKRLKNKVKSMAQQHAQELKRLSSALEHTSLLLREEKEKHGEKAEKYESAIEELLQQSRDQEKILRDMHTDEDDDDEVEKLINESQTKSQRNELVTRQNHVKSAIKKKTQLATPPVVVQKDAVIELQASPINYRLPRKKDVVDKNNTSTPVMKQTKNVEQLPLSQASEYVADTDEETDVREELEALQHRDIDGAYGTAAFSSLGQSAELSITEDMVGTLIRGARLQQHLRKEPTLLQGMKEELLDLLRDQLDERGIPPQTTGISNTVLNNKLDLLDKERQQLSKKYKNFTEIRRQYERRIDKLAKAQLAAHPKSPKTPPNRPSPPSPRKSQGTPKHNPSSPRRGGGVPGFERLSPDQPLPAPRISQTLSTTGSSMPSASHWDTDDDETEGEDSETEERLAAVNRANVMPTAASGGTWPRSASKQRNTIDMTQRAKSDNEDSEWDSEISELIDMPLKHSGPQKPISGSKVMELSRSIEAQLQNRSSDVKPAGSIDTVAKTDANKSSNFSINKQPAKLSFRYDDDNDSLSLSISSLQDGPRPAPRPRNSSRTPQGDTELSNTYGTSVWGSTSKGIANPKSSVSVTDWDSDLDLDDL